MMRDAVTFKKLSEISTLKLGKTPFRKDAKFWDPKKETTNVWLSIADLVHGHSISDSKEYISDLGAKNIFKVRAGTLLLSFKLTIGRVSFAGRDLYTNEAIVALDNLSASINKYYLLHYFSFYDWDKLSEVDVKIKGKTLNKAKLKNIEIPVPPLEVQNQIVEKLDTAFAAIEVARANLEKNIQNAKELFQSKLNEVFSQKGEGWVFEPFSQFMDIRDGTHDSPKYIDENENSFPLVTSKNLKNGKLLLTNVKHITAVDYDTD